MRHSERLWSRVVAGLGTAAIVLIPSLISGSAQAADDDPIVRSVGVIPVYWEVAKPAPLDAAGIKNAVAEADRYLNDVSFGHTRLTMGTVRPWLKIEDKYDNCASSLEIQAEVRRQLGRVGLDDNMVIALAPGQGCTDREWTEYDASLGVAWSTAALDVASPKESVTHIRPDIDVASVLRSGEPAGSPAALTCWSDAGKTVRVPLSSYCDVESAGDPWDPAGNQPYGLSGLPIPSNLANLRADDKFSHSIRVSAESARFRLRPMSTPGPWLLSAYPFSLEFRPSIGVDAWTDDRTAVIDGKTRTNPGGGVVVRDVTSLLDMHPDGSFDPARRHPGLDSSEAWATPDGEWRFTVRSTTPDEAVIDVRNVVNSIDRRSGADRFETSAQAIHQRHSGTVFVASGRVFADALSGAPAAGTAFAPILLTDTGALPDSVASSIAALEPDKIVVLGGPATVSDAVLTKLGALAPAVERWNGADRFAVSATVSQKSFQPGAPVAFIASGHTFPDALSAGPVAAKLGGPILLTDKDSIPGVIRGELSRLKPGRIVVLGGPATIDTDVERELASYTSGKVERWGGKDRYEVAAQAASGYAPGSAAVTVVSGELFSDALSGGPLAAWNGGPLLLVTRDRIPDATAAQLRRLKPEWVTIVGGPATVSADVAEQLRSFVD